MSVEMFLGDFLSWKKLRLSLLACLFILKVNLTDWVNPAIVYTRENAANVVTNLTCSRLVAMLFQQLVNWVACSHRLFPACWQVVNGLLTTCYKVELNRQVVPTTCYVLQFNNLSTSCRRFCVGVLIILIYRAKLNFKERSPTWSSSLSDLLFKPEISSILTVYSPFASVCSFCSMN
jgi:hypothetical protein